MTSSKLPELILTDEEREVLTDLSQRETKPARLSTRARIVLACAEGGSNTDVAERLGLARSSVATWRERFVHNRMDGLADEPRPGRVPRVYDEQVEKVVLTALETTPVDAGRWTARWTTRLLSEQLGMPQTTVSWILRDFGFVAGGDTVEIGGDPSFPDRVRDVVGLHLDPPARAVALCTDEKNPDEAADLVRGQERLDRVRHGVTSLSGALALAAGRETGGERRLRSRAFLAFLRAVEDTVPAELDVHVVLDTPDAVTTPAVKAWLGEHPRFHTHLTPTSQSWVNLVERYLAEITVRLLRRGVHRPITPVDEAIRAWVEDGGTTPHTWTRTADEVGEALVAHRRRIVAEGSWRKDTGAGEPAP